MSESNSRACQCGSELRASPGPAWRQSSKWKKGNCDGAGRQRRGKSTILKTISGIIDPSKGQIRFEGGEIQSRDPAWIVRRGISHVPEGREVFPLLTVEENLRMGAYTRGDAGGIAEDIDMVYGYFRFSRSAPGRRRACCRAGSSRCWRSAARCCRGRR